MSAIILTCHGGLATGCEMFAAFVGSAAGGVVSLIFPASGAPSHVTFGTHIRALYA